MAIREKTLSISGFKSIRDQRNLTIRPLTLLAGRNSSGKSSAMQSLLLLKQTLDAQYEPAGPLLLDGPNVSFSAAKEFFWRGGADGLPVKIAFVDWEPLAWSFDTRDPSLVFSLSPGGVVLDRMTYLDHARGGRRQVELREGLSNDELSAATQIELLNAGPRWEQRVIRRRCYLDVQAFPVDQPSGVGGAPSVFPFAFVAPALGKLVHVPGLRGQKRRLYLTSHYAANNVSGEFTSYFASILAVWTLTNDERLERLQKQLLDLGLTGAINARHLSESAVEIQVGRLPILESTDLVNIADVGIGVSQVLPILVAMLVAETDQIVYVEQPELHLHPSAEVVLAGCMLDAAKRGVIVVAETHSNLLLKGVQATVGEQPGLNQLVKLHWFSRNREGVTQVDSKDLDERGRFGDWKEDLSDVELEVESRYLDASLGK